MTIRASRYHDISVGHRVCKHRPIIGVDKGRNAARAAHGYHAPHMINMKLNKLFFFIFYSLTNYIEKLP